MSKPPKVRACLFDMDGLLIDSERIYTEVTNKFLALHGKGPLPAEIKAQLMGRPGPQVLIPDLTRTPGTVVTGRRRQCC